MNENIKIDYMSQFNELISKVYNDRLQEIEDEKLLDSKKQLIKVCSQIDRTGTYYGNSNTGVLNNEKVIELIHAFDKHK